MDGEVLAYCENWRGENGASQQCCVTHVRPLDFPGEPCVTVVGRRLCIRFCESCVPHRWLPYGDKKVLTLQARSEPAVRVLKSQATSPKAVLPTLFFGFRSSFSSTQSAFPFNCSLTISDLLILPF